MYEELEQIGEGAFGRVAKVRRVEDGRVLVWKEIFFGSMSEREKQMLVDEVNLMREFVDHPNIVRYYDRVIDRENKRIFIVMEYCSGGDLAAAIKRQKLRRCYFDEPFLWSVLQQVSFAVEVCHRRQGGCILHRDLKPNNILLDASRTTVKLGDFGLAKVLNDRSMFARSHVGTPTYMSPEQVRERKYGMKSDIWSLGCLMYEMACFVPPFRAKNQLALAKKITSGHFDPLPGHYSDTLVKLIESMLEIKPRNRPSVSEVLQSCERYCSSIDCVEDDYNRIEGQPEVMCSEEKMIARENALRQREHQLIARENELQLREQKLCELDRSMRRQLSERESAVSARESQLDQRERELLKKQQNAEMLYKSEGGSSLGRDFVTPKTLRTMQRIPRPLSTSSVRKHSSLTNSSDILVPQFDKEAVLSRLNSVRRSRIPDFVSLSPRLPDTRIGSARV